MKISGPAKRFGARYGVKIRKRIDDIEKEARARHVCPYCGKKAVKRVAHGIWKCKKCGAVFTAKAYSPKI